MLVWRLLEGSSRPPSPGACGHALTPCVRSPTLEPEGEAAAVTGPAQPANELSPDLHVDPSVRYEVGTILTGTVRAICLPIVNRGL
jgi:hypothetical protein